MTRIAAILASALVAVGGGVAYASSMGGAMHTAMHGGMFTPSTMKWGPGSGDLKGLSVAVLDGNPSASGPFTIRIKIPAGTKFPVHYHNETERLTVISGTFLAAIGTKFDASKFTAFPAGSFVVIPAGIRHFGAANVDTILQLNADGPFTMKMDKM